MGKCKKCGVEVPKEAMFCPNCGAGVSKEASVEKLSGGKGSDDWWWNWSNTIYSFSNFCKYKTKSDRFK